MNARELIDFCLNAPLKIAVLIEGNHGIGKSQVMLQYAQEYKEKLIAKFAGKGLPFDPDNDFAFIDFRLAQNEVGDIKGLPLQAGGFTHFAPPSFFPVHPEDEKRLAQRLEDAGHKYAPFNRAKYGVLFLDEINRATKETLAAVFELILDRRLNGIRIPDGWRIVSAMNGNQDLYTQVLELDPALLDRFAYVKFVPLYEDLFAWAKGTHKEHDIDQEIRNYHPAVESYLNKKHEAVDPSPEEIEHATEKTEKIQSRRSWARLSDTLSKYAADFENGDGLFDPFDLTDSRTEVAVINIATAFVGSHWSLDFVNFVKHDYKVLSAKEVINKYSDAVVKHIKAAGAPEMSKFVDELVKELKVTSKKLNEKQKGNLLRFVQDCKNEVAAKFWYAWSGEASLKAQSDDWYDNLEVKIRMLECLGNPEKARKRIDELKAMLAEQKAAGKKA